MMPRRAGTTRGTMHADEALIEELDLRLLVQGLVHRKGLQWVHAFFSGLQRRNRGSLRKACAELGPLAVSTLLTAMTGAKTWKDRIHSSELLLLFGGHKPVEKVPMGGGNGGMVPQFHMHFDMTKLSTDDLQQLRALVTKARPALTAGITEIDARTNGS